jgi:hypothetical protein
MNRQPGILIALALAASSSATVVQPNGDLYARVQMLMYSGRADPVWILTPEQSKLFVAKLKALPRSAKAQKLPENLGYRGFSVHIGTRQDVRVFRNTVLLYNDKVMTAHADPTQSLEKWLMQTRPKDLPVGIPNSIRGKKT